MCERETEGAIGLPLEKSLTERAAVPLLLLEWCVRLGRLTILIWPFCRHRRILARYGRKRIFFSSSRSTPYPVPLKPQSSLLQQLMSSCLLTTRSSVLSGAVTACRQVNPWVIEYLRRIRQEQPRGAGRTEWHPMCPLSAATLICL